MIKKTVTYTDYDGNRQTRDLYFHLSRGVLAENLDLKEEFETLAPRIEALPEGADVPPAIIGDLFRLIKRISLMAYGVRQGSDSFEQSEKISREFQASAAYDEFLWNLMKDQQAWSFLADLLPSDLRDAAEKQIAGQEKLPLEEPTKTREQELEEELARMRANQQ